MSSGDETKLPLELVRGGKFDVELAAALFRRQRWRRVERREEQTPVS